MKPNRIRKTAFILTVLLLLAGCMKKPEAVSLTADLLKIGKADAIVIRSGGQTMLIDTGEDDDGEEITEFLEHHKISAVDVMVITHFDQDHVGGADAVLEHIPVKAVCVPDYEGTHEEYLEFLQAVGASDAAVEKITRPTAFRLGDAEILIEPPASYEISDPDKDYDNNFSLITTVTHGENKMIFMADAQKKRIREWLKDHPGESCDFLKVPHHGIYNKALDELFGTLHPEYAVICSSEKNPAEQKTLQILRQFCPNVYETKDGDVLVISNGTSLSVQQSSR